MSMSVVSLLSSMFTVYMEGHSDVSRPPRWIRIFCFRFLARAFCIHNEIPDVPEEDSVKPFTEVKLEDMNDAKKGSGGGVKGEMGKVLARLEYFVKHLEEKKKGDAIVDEWKLVAKTIDRLLFFVCFIIIFIFFMVMVAAT